MTQEAVALKAALLQVLEQHPVDLPLGDVAGAFHHLYGTQLQFSSTEVLNALGDAVEVMELGSKGPLALGNLVIDTHLGQAGEPLLGTRATSPMESDGTLSNSDNKEEKNKGAAFHQAGVFLGQVLRGFPCGMTLRRLHHILQTEGVLQDLPRHWDSLEFVYLLFHVPGIKLWVPNNGTEVVAYRAVPDPSAVQRLVHLILGYYGTPGSCWTVPELESFMAQTYGLDLEGYSQEHGYRGTVDFLRSMPDLALHTPLWGGPYILHLYAGPTLSPTHMIPPPLNIEPLCEILAPSDPQPFEPPVSAQRLETLFLKHLDQGALDRVLSLLRDGLMEHPGGLELGVLKKAVRRGLGVDLEDLSWDMGFRGTLELLSNLPGVWVWGPEKGDHCILHMERGLDEVLALLAGGLVGAPAGAELCELQEAMGMELGVDLEQLGRDLGYASAKDFLTHVPGLQLQDPERGSHCVVQLQRDFIYDPAVVQKYSSLDPGHAGHKRKKPWPGHQEPCCCCSQGMDSHSNWGDMDSGVTMDVPVPSWAKLNDAPCAIQPACLDPVETTQLAGPKPGLGQLSAAILECLRGYSSGLRVETLKKVLCQRQAMDLEDFVKYGGYGNTVELLQQVPEVQLLFPERGEKCLVRLKTDLDVLEGLIQDILTPFPSGLRVKKLKEILVKKHGTDLECWSQDTGYRDVVSCLKDMPGLRLRAPGRSNNCLVQIQNQAAVPVVWQPSSSPPSPPISLPDTEDLPRDICIDTNLSSSPGGPILQLMVKSKSKKPQGNQEDSGLSPSDSAKPLSSPKGHLSSAASPAPPDNCWFNPQLPSTTKSLAQETPGAPAVQGMLSEQLLPNAHLPAWLMNSPQSAGTPLGLQVSKDIQGPGPQLDSASSGLEVSKETPVGRAQLDSPPQSPWAHKESPGPGAQLVSAPSVLSMNKERKWSSTQLDTIPSGPKTGKETQRPTTQLHRAPWGPWVEEETQEQRAQLDSTPLGLWPQEEAKVLRTQPARADMPRANPGCTPSTQPPKDLAELKQNVASILAQHPQGISVFQFRAAYSATYQHPLPLGPAASAKQRLAEMPDVVRIQGYGVQTLLLPVSNSNSTGGDPGFTLLIPEEAADPVGDPDKLAEPPPVLAPQPPGGPWGPESPPAPWALPPTQAVRPKAALKKPDLVPSAPVITMEMEPSSSSWTPAQTELLPVVDDASSASHPVVYPPLQQIPLPDPIPLPSSLQPAKDVGAQIPQAQAEPVQPASPTQDLPHPSPRAGPVSRVSGQYQDPMGFLLDPSPDVWPSTEDVTTPVTIAGPRAEVSPLPTPDTNTFRALRAYLGPRQIWLENRLPGLGAVYHSEEAFLYPIAPTASPQPSPTHSRAETETRRTPCSIVGWDEPEVCPCPSWTDMEAPQQPSQPHNSDRCIIL
ncbi:uncharacterized protein LOC102384528 isoform X1 [Alligator sinensis]|uniref:Uncharacterized protein LOC102384528 isoform X1 n=3 Tax=Alligator sinensis TaxID=38654 RepID=A0A3Q0GZH1_ALLSI|nr:uncharacterized protein LOC102384528 isoform X1 [Alligator sinensis]XP_025063563.1 uncharacterized protein LOC102384528 isoform X1 [Alligator sinensis]